MANDNKPKASAAELFCACGRIESDCDQSRAACPKNVPRGSDTNEPKASAAELSAFNDLLSWLLAAPGRSFDVTYGGSHHTVKLWDGLGPSALIGIGSDSEFGAATSQAFADLAHSRDARASDPSPGADAPAEECIQ